MSIKRIFKNKGLAGRILIRRRKRNMIQDSYFLGRKRRYRPTA